MEEKKIEEKVLTELQKAAGGPDSAGTNQPFYSHRIKEGECIGCGTCQGVCPVGAISPKGEVYVIDAAQCINCESCWNACPIEAIESPF